MRITFTGYFPGKTASSAGVRPADPIAPGLGAVEAGPAGEPAVDAAVTFAVTAFCRRIDDKDAAFLITVDAAIALAVGADSLGIVLRRFCHS